MTSNKNLDRAWVIRERARSSLKSARHEYSDSFGRSYADKSIDREIDELVDNAIVDHEQHVSIPIELALAVILRQGFGRSRGKQPRSASKFIERGLKLALREAECRKVSLMEEGHSADTAPVLAADEVAEGSRWSAAQILDGLRHPGRFAFRATSQKPTRGSNS